MGPTEKLEFIVEYAKGVLGRIWLARIVDGDESGRLVAVRRSPLDAASLGEASRVLDTASMARNVKHPAVAKLLGASLERSELRVVSEYVEGEYLSTFRALLFRAGRRAGLGPAVALRVVRDAVLAAQAGRRGLAALGVPHAGRVLFADSLIVARYGETLVSDLGVAGDIDRWLCTDMDEPGFPALIVPGERAAPGGSAERADVFAAAVLVLELITHRPLATLDQAEAALYEIEAGSVGSPAEQRAKWSALAAVLARSIAAEPERRYASLAEFRAALELASPCALAADTEVARSLDRLAGTRLRARQKLSGAARGRDSLPAPSSLTTHRPSAMRRSMTSIDTGGPTPPGGSSTAALAVSARSDEPESRTPSTIEFARRSRMRRSTSIAIGGGLLLLAVGGLVLAMVPLQGPELAPDPARHSGVAALRPDPASATTAAPTGNDDPPVDANVAAPDTQATDLRPVRSLPAAKRSPRRGGGTRSSSPRAASSAEQPPAHGAPGRFRPNSIAPYRPGGI